MKKLRVTVLGATGSVGANTLDVLARHPDLYEVFALTASTRVDLLLAQCVQFRPQFAVMANEPEGRELERKVRDAGLATRVLWSAEALCEVAAHESVDAVMAAIVGAAGLAPCLAAARAGKRLLLANKEALVVGGDVFLQAVREGGATLLPNDSEHSAIFQSLPDDPLTWADRVEKIILTASGGPFRTRDVATLCDVTPDQACAHPNWVMGRKISVDSATMMNKALEVIEARFLFGLAPRQIEVIVHPQSIIHSMVQYRDASVIAQLGTPDMRGPIAYGLSWPARIESGAAAIDFTSIPAMTFEPADASRFPGLQLAWQTLEAVAGTTAVLNAANEIAVEAFLNRRIRFNQIHDINVATLSGVTIRAPEALGDLLDIDARSRERALQEVARTGD